MHKDLKAWTRVCPVCLQYKLQRYNKAPIRAFPSPHERFIHVCLDIVGPSPLPNGCSHPLICMNRFTRWPEVIPLPGVTVRTVVKAFTSRWVDIFGGPSIITADRDTQFESHLFQALLFFFLGFTCIFPAAYHSPANVRIQHGTRKNVLSVDRLKSAVTYTLLDEPSGPLLPDFLSLLLPVPNVRCY
ncbi:hypothetical protein SprV_0100122700 [Sparganum proliferum]